MRYLTTMILAALTLVGCSEIEDNSPAVQAERDGTFFRANNTSVGQFGTNQFAIVGITPLETLTLIVPELTPGTYPLAAGTDATATYVFNGGTPFSTQDDDSNGEIVITGSGGNTLSGTFSFVSYRPNKTDTVYFRKGVFYEVPFTNGSISGGGIVTTAFSAQIDGASFTPGTINGMSAAGSITVIGSTGSTTISLTFPESITPGTYAMGVGTQITAQYVNGATPLAFDSGSLTIVSIDTVAKTVVGTFNFTTPAPNSNMITNGSFSVIYN